LADVTKRVADVTKRGSLWRQPMADVIKTNGCVIQ
jgi:hypothetical protein